MDDHLKAKLLANDELSLELEEYEEQDKQFGDLEKGFSSFYRDPDQYLSTATFFPELELTWEHVNITPLEDVKRGLCSRIGAFISPTIRERQNSKERRHILDNVFGVAKSCEILAILGSSVEVQGSIKVNGLNMGRKRIRRISAYVQQNDLFIGTMTVREHLSFSVRLRMGRNCSAEEQKQRVDNIMKELDLTHCADTQIGWPHRLKGISGGERKRLAFASEILTNPPLLFCDEPTSGLDAYLGRQVINVLKNLARNKRMTVVLTIHQPSSQVFELFDKVCLLANGRVAFLGTSEQAIQQWTQIGEPVPENFNPADHFISSLAATNLDEQQAAEKVRKICDYYERSEVANGFRETIKQPVPDENSSTASALSMSIHRRQKYRATWFQQFTALTKRSFLVTLREPMLLKVRFMQTVISALLLGIIYFNTQLRQSTIMNVNGLLYQASTSMNFLFQFASVGIFCEEYPVFLRENLAGVYRVDTYFIAKNVAESVQYILYPTVFSTILYWMSGLYRTFDAFAFFTINMILMTNVAISIAYAFACIFARVDIAIAVLPVLVIPLLAFGGFFINQATLPIYFLPLRFLSYFGFVYENLVVNEWEHIDDYIPGCSELSQNSTCLRTGRQVIKSLGFSRQDILPNMIALVVMIFVFRIIAGIALGIRAARRK